MAVERDDAGVPEGGQRRAGGEDHVVDPHLGQEEHDQDGVAGSAHPGVVEERDVQEEDGQLREGERSGVEDERYPHSLGTIRGQSSGVRGVPRLGFRARTSRVLWYVPR